MKHNFKIIILITVIFVGYILGYSIPPFIHSGIISGRDTKGVEDKIDKKAEEFYKNLYKENEE